MAFTTRIFKRGTGSQPGVPQTSDPTPGTEDVALIPGDQPVPEQPTQVLPAVGPASHTPLSERRPGFRERGRMRRRRRYLGEVRELGFRDLGGLVFDQHRFQRPNQALVAGKVAALDAIDREARALGAALQDRTTYSELFIAGLSACQRCGGLHGTDARFCHGCGLAFSGPRFVTGVGAEHHQVYPGAPAAPGQAALFDPQNASPQTALAAPSTQEATPRAAPAPVADAADPDTAP